MSEANEHIQVFHGVKNTLDPGFHRGDEYSVIFLPLPLRNRGNVSPSFGKGRQGGILRKDHLRMAEQNKTTKEILQAKLAEKKRTPLYDHEVLEKLRQGFQEWKNGKRDAY